MDDFLKAVALGVIQGLTEFLPVSSTGHLLIANQFIRFSSPEFTTMFDIVIQLGSILAVVLVFWKRLFPFSRSLTPPARQQVWSLWAKALVGFVPTGIAAFLLSHWFEKNFYNAFTVAFSLIFYGVVFIVVERQKRQPRIERVEDLSYWWALAIGAIQILALVPGTSRSGVTIIGALLLGASRVAAAEFTFFMAIPTMFVASGYSLFKYLKDSGWGFNGSELISLITGFAVAFLVAWAVIVAFMKFIQKHTFTAFGIYRIVLGVVVLAYFAWTGAAVVHG